MTIHNPYSWVPTKSVSVDRSVGTPLVKHDSAIGGWLWLLAIGLVISPIAVGYTFVSHSVDVALHSWRLPLDSGNSTYGSRSYTAGSWTVFLEERTYLSSPQLSSLLKTEFALNLALILLHVCVGYQFIRRSRTFARWFISSRLAHLGIILFDAEWAAELFGAAARVLRISDPSSDVWKMAIGQMLAGLLSLCIWGPYLSWSQRSKATFVR